MRILFSVLVMALILSGCASNEAKKTANRATPSARTPANDPSDELGDPVDPADQLVMLKKLSKFKGKMDEGKKESLKAIVKNILDKKPGVSITAFGCNKLNPLGDDNIRRQYTDCTFRVLDKDNSGESLIEINFGANNWMVENLKITNASYKVIAG